MEGRDTDSSSGFRGPGAACASGDGQAVRRYLTRSELRVGRLEIKGDSHMGKGIRQGPFVPGEPNEPLNTCAASGILPSSVKEVVKLSVLGAIKKRIEFLQRIGEHRAARVLRVGDHNDVVTPRHLDAVAPAALSGGPPRRVCRTVGNRHSHFLSDMW